MIGRLDDIMKMKFENLISNMNYNFALNVKICWSKNIIEERDSPVQIVIGSMDERIGTLLHLSIYLELYGFGKNK